jgi:hypothetical protein
MSAELAAAEDRLLGLEAEAVHLRHRIREAADRGDTDATIALYQRIPELRLALLAARHVIARRSRREQRSYGQSPGMDRAEHLLDVELATLGVQTDESMRRVFG